MSDFEAARQRAALQAIVARFAGKPVSLLSYEQVAEQLRIVGRAERGRQIIPTEAIVGSVGRYNDFTREFLPRMAQDASRWARVKVAAPNVGDLPPIEVYQVGEAYFVLDGNHRVSIARREGVEYLDAYVTEIRTRVPLSPKDSPDELIAKAEYAAFLDYTRLDQIRPGAVLEATVPGQHGRLENLIEVHRFFLEEAEAREIPWSEAVERWYDESYLPVVEAIREQEILKRFPDRTETDLYVWLAVHRAALQHHLEWQMGAEAAVTALAPELNKEPTRGVLGWLKRLWLRLMQKIRPGRSGDLSLSWARGKRLARYSEGFLADLLLLWDGKDKRLLESAYLIARREQSHLHVVVLEEEAERAPELATLRKRFSRGQVRVSVSEAVIPADRALSERAVLADLILLSRSLMLDHGDEQTINLLSTVVRAGRPVLVGAFPAGGLKEIRLEMTDSRSGEGALFVATYLAEHWQLPLVALGRNVPDTMLAHAQAYAAVHEVDLRPASKGDQETEARALLVIGMRERRLGRWRTVPGLSERLASTSGPLLLAP